MRVTAILVPILAAFQLLAGDAAASGSGGTKAPVRVAQAAASTSLGSQTARSEARLDQLLDGQKRLKAQMAELRRVYNSQLAEVDKLKKARASWRRDSKLRAQKARSQKTAMALQKLDRKLRAQRTLVRSERKRLAAAIRRELAASPSPARQKQLARTLKKVRQGLRRAPKKIAMPDLELDEFADPEELMEQVALIERAEAELARQQKQLERRANRYAHMEELRAKRNRADALGAFDDDRVRRSTGRIGGPKDARTEADSPSAGGAGLSDSDSSQDPGSPAPPESFEDDGGFDAVSVVLADVVDEDTQNALRKAQRSSSLRTKARATAKARKQVQSQLEVLRSSRARILRHLQRLQKR
jgi:hypothetical protein